MHRSRTDIPTLSRRQKTLKVDIPYRGSEGPLHLLVDSTGIKAEGEGEWFFLFSQFLIKYDEFKSPHYIFFSFLWVLIKHNKLLNAKEYIYETGSLSAICVFFQSFNEVFFSIFWHQSLG